MRVAFHSYKGGVGRTKIMIGVGVVLAMRGYKVGMLDFDLDASGLATFFGDDQDEELKKRDLINILTTANLSLLPGAIRDETPMVDRVLEDEKRKNTGKLHYIPTLTDPELTDGLDLRKSRIPIDDVLADVEEQCGRDFLLVDLKPGYSPSFKVIIPHVQHAVVVARIDEQNINGLKTVIPVIKNVPGMEVSLVANMVPDHPKSKDRLRRLEENAQQEVDVKVGLNPDWFFDDEYDWIQNKNSPLRMGLEVIADKLTGNT